MKKPRAIDLFSGCGGLTVGLKRAGFQVLAAVEIDPLANETYRANHSDVTLVERDLRQVAAVTLMRRLGLKRGDLDLLAGCPPCQGFSVLRTRNGARRNRDKKNGLLLEMLRFVRAFRPKMVMMENVPGLLTRVALREFKRGLGGLGYKVSCAVRDAAKFNVPQRRKRLILLAGSKVDVRLPSELRSIRTVRDAIGHLPRAGTSGDALHDVPEKRTEKVARLIRSIPKNGGSRQSLPRAQQLRCHKRFRGFADVYGRMAWDSVAPTITSGCSNPSKGRFLHPSRNRAITLREAALLQTFPGRYRFALDAGKEAIALMIGNALPPEFIRRHALAVTKALTSRDRSRRIGRSVKSRHAG